MMIVPPDRAKSRNRRREHCAVFDLLTQPAPELSPEERAEVKKVARELYAQKCSILFEHIFESDPARDSGVYVAAG